VSALGREARAQLGAAARERIRTELSLERFLEGTRDQYEAALGGGTEVGQAPKRG
jgi:hypothetical protein